MTAHPIPQKSVDSTRLSKAKVGGERFDHQACGSRWECDHEKAWGATNFWGLAQQGNCTVSSTKWQWFNFQGKPSKWCFSIVFIKVYPKSPSQVTQLDWFGQTGHQNGSSRLRGHANPSQVPFRFRSQPSGWSCCSPGRNILCREPCPLPFWLLLFSWCSVGKAPPFMILNSLQGGAPQL